MTTFGPPIPHELGTPKLEWLGDDELCLVTFGNPDRAINWNWEHIESFQIRADHPASIATAKGFTYWPGGGVAPEDWDGDPKDVLYRDGFDSGRSPRRWAHWDTDSDIIGYHRRVDTAHQHAAAIREKVIRECLAAIAEQNYSSACRAALENLLPKPEPTAAERYADRMKFDDDHAYRVAIIAAFNAGRADRG